MTDSTRRVLDFLSDPASYAHGPKKVRMLQTHASWVFLAPPLVCKIKKPVNLGFLDYSTLELRRADCDREVELNRRLAPDIYLGVETVRETDGRLHFGGQGEVVEWCVMMRELDPRFLLSHRLREGTAGRDDMDRIAARLRDFHAAQPPPPEDEVRSAIERQRLATDGNFQVAREWIGRSLPRGWFDAITAFTEGFYQRQAALLESRIRGGWIRDCHGDLHAEHVHLAPDAVRIYDCIAFNTRFRFIDIASDIAFLAMDLDFNDRPDLSNHLVSRFAALMRDPGMKPLLDFYKCYRACVRGKVESLHSAAETADAAERTASLATARRYFQLALRYAVAGSDPGAFVFMGRVASGKSALAGAFGDALGWRVLSSDRIRKSLAGVPAETRPDSETRAGLYSAEMTGRTYAALFEDALRMLDSGHGVILDATFSKRAHRDAWSRHADERGFRTVWVEAAVGDDVTRQRLRARESAPGVVSDARLEDLTVLSAAYERPDEIPGLLTIANEAPLEDVLDTLLLELARRRTTPGPA